MAMVLVGMSFAAIPTGADDDDVLPPTVTKTLSDDEIYFGTGVKETTVTIEATGDGGTSSTITPLDVVFAIDSSGSMGWNDPGDLRLDAAMDFVDKMDDSRDQGGVVSWDSGVDFTFGLSDDFDDTDGLKYEIGNVDSSGGTNLNVGLFEAIDMLDANTRVDASVEVIIFLTDGQGIYTYSGVSGSPADEAATNGYIIYSIGLGSPSSGPLEDMAVATGGAYFDSPDADNLDDIYDAIYDELVTSTVPHYVDIVEVLESYIIIDFDSFNIDPDSVTNNIDGTTTLVWENVGMYDDEDPDFSADEVVILTFKVRSAIYGTDMDVQVEGEAVVMYYDFEENYIGSVDIPQATITVHPYVTDLIAGGGNANSAIDVGDLTVWNDLDYLYIMYETTGDWYMTETHLHVTPDGDDDIPQTKKNNPIPGKFDYKGVHDPAIQEFTYTIPWTWEPLTTLSIAAHASVQMVTGYDDNDDPIYQMETAWADGDDFEGNNWATYIEYVDP